MMCCVSAISGNSCGPSSSFRALPEVALSIFSRVFEKREMVAGQERVVWNPARSLPAKEFELTDPEVARIKAALQTWDSSGAASDRHWLKPLVEALFPSDIGPQRPSSRP
jgi:hypothetical protein